MQNLTNDLKRIELFNCGYCTNNMCIIMKNEPSSQRIFPASVILIKHKKYGNIIFDTGYSRDIYKCGFVGGLYNILNPTFCTEEDEIVNKLKAIGISTDEINYVILSHLHPDHIGGLKFFTNATFVISQITYDLYKKHSMGDLIFSRLLPKNFACRLEVVDINQSSPKYSKYFETYCDYFQDESLIFTMMQGHTKGQMCLYLPTQNIFLGADSCWSLDFIHRIGDMRMIARMIQKDYPEMKRNADVLSDMVNDGVRVILCHDRNPEGIIWEENVDEQ